MYAGSTTGSIFYAVDGGKNWKLLVSKPPRRTTLLGFSVPGQSMAAVSLPKNIVRKIATFSASGTNYLAVAMDDGVFLSANQGATWQQIHPGTTDAKKKPDGGAWGFVSTHLNAKTFVGMDTGAFPIDVEPHPPVWWKISLGIVVGALVLLGLCIFNFNTGFGETLHIPNNVSILLNAIATSALLIFPVLLIALVALLAFLAWERTEKWLQERRTHTPGAIQALAVGQNDALLAGTEHGIYRSSNSGESWTQAEQGPSSDIRVLEPYAAQHLFAGTHDGAIFRSQDDGAHWENYLPASPFASIQDVLVDSSGVFAAGTISSADIDGQWSRFQVQNRQIYLDKAYPALKAGGWAILQQEQQVELYKVESVSQVVTGDYRKNRKVTCIGVDRADQLSTFDRRTTLLFAQSEQLTPYSDEPVEGTSILLSSSVPDLTPDRRLVVQGKRARVRILDTLAKDLVLASADGLQEVPFDQDDTYVLMAPPADPHASASTWLLRDRNGFVGTLTTSANVVVTYEPANDEDENVGEMVTLKEVQQQVMTDGTRQTEQTLLSFQSPLQNAYDRATLVISANIVYATHGQTIANEILDNSGSANNAYRYALKQKPLTYVPATTPAGSQSTLSVMVNNVRWHQVSSIQELNTLRRSYLLRRDSQDNTTIYFSAGSQSAKLPTGTERLTATYRIGIGEVGNVAANSLTLLRTRPAGIQKVTNPLPASGGTNPDTLEQMRTLAPLQSSTTQRIVSLNDYEHFARMFAGIDKVQVKALWSGRQRIAYITIAGSDGAPVTQDSALYSDLLDAIQAATTSPTRVVSLASFELLYFQLRARLLISPDCIDQRDTIMADATRAISAAFSFAQRDLAQDVTASEIIAILQQVPDVLAVELESLHVKDVPQKGALNTILEARAGRSENGKLLPAQMLLIDTKNNEGIVLDVEVLR